MRSWLDGDQQRPGLPPDVRRIADATVTVIPIGRTSVLPAGAKLVIRVGHDGTWSAAIASASLDLPSDGSER